MPVCSAGRGIIGLALRCNGAPVDPVGELLVSNGLLLDLLDLLGFDRSFQDLCRVDP